MEEIGRVCEAVSTQIEEVRDVVSPKIDIEEVRNAASARYEDLTVAEKQAAKEFFKAIDKDNSNSISISEFRTFLSEAGLQTDNHDWLFEELDKDKNKTLNFEELVTFFYVLSCDKYKHLFNCKPNTNVPSQKAGTVMQAGTGRQIVGANGQAGTVMQAGTGRQTVEANGQGKKWDMNRISGLYDKLKGVCRLGESVSAKVNANANECSIL